MNKFGKATEPSYRAVIMVITEMVSKASDLLMGRSKCKSSP
jgi:hypothetical protein